jgi:hypothetical protein
MPAVISGFNCEEYLASPHFRSGVFLERVQLQVVYAEHELHVVDHARFLAIGSAGADGIEFGYRAGEVGLWAYYPVEQDFQWVAESIGQLVEGYDCGAITV